MLGLTLAGCSAGGGPAYDPGPPGVRLLELWSSGLPAFGVFVPDERGRGARAPDGSRPPALYTSEGARGLADNPLYDYLFLDLESRYDGAAVQALVAGLASAEGPAPALLVRIPPISVDGVAEARARVRQVLSMGADGVVFPHVRDLDEARLAVGFFSEAGADVWSPGNPAGTVVAMLMIEDPVALSAVDEIAALPGYSLLACGIGSLTRALGGDRNAAEVGNLAVLDRATRAGLPDMITANSDDVVRRIDEGFLGLLMSGPGADDAIRVGREHSGRSPEP